MFGEKLKKLRTDNQLTQEELAEKLFVTRTAISKWETGKGYPSIDSLKALSNLFGISIDDLIADDDLENHRLLEEAKARRCYWCAIACLALATGAAVARYLTRLHWLSMLSMLGAAGYLILGLLAKPKYKRVSAKKLVIPYVLPAGNSGGCSGNPDFRLPANLIRSENPECCIRMRHSGFLYLGALHKKEQAALWVTPKMKGSHRIETGRTLTFLAERGNNRIT